MTQRVVLMRPSGPRNVGSIVRACANFAPVELVLVAPEKPSILIHPDFEQMAHGVPGIPERIRVVATLAEALADCEWSYGFTARVRDARVLSDWSEIVERVRGQAREADVTVALVFGNEITGLSADEGGLVAELVRLPTSDEQPSVNLALAVGIVLWSLFEGKALKTRPSRLSFIKGEAREYLIAHLGDVLGNAALSKTAKQDIEASIERVFRRGPIETRDARAWHAILRALGNSKIPQDYGLPLQKSKEERLAAGPRGEAKPPAPAAGA